MLKTIIKACTYVGLVLIAMVLFATCAVDFSRIGTTSSAGPTDSSAHDVESIRDESGASDRQAAA
jgi:hypothetical protein